MDRLISYDKTNKRLLELLDDLDAIVYVIDIDTYEVLYLNKHGKELWGDIQGKICWEAIEHNQSGPCESCNNRHILEIGEGKFHKTLYHDRLNDKWLDERAHLIHWLGGKKAKLGIAMDVTDRRKMEEELYLSELRFSSLFNTINSGVAVYEVSNDGSSGRDYIIKDFNQAALRIEGQRKEDVIGKKLSELRPNIDDFGIIEIFQKVWKTGVSHNYPAKIYKDSKFLNWYENQIYKLPTGEIVAVFDDVTANKNAEEALRESEQKFKGFVDNAPSMIYTMTEEGRFIYVSHSWIEQLGYEQHEVEGKHFAEFVYPGDLEICQKFLQNAIETRAAQKNITYRVRHKNGTLHWHKASGSVIENQNGDILYCIGVANDISEQVKYEQELLKSNQELEAALEEILSIEEELRVQYENLERREKELRDSMRLQEDIIQFLPDPTFVINTQGIVVSWNKAMEELSGIKAEDILGKGDYEYAIPFYRKRRPVLIDLVLNYAEEDARAYQKVIMNKDNKALTVEDYYLDSQDTGRYLSIKASPLYNSKGEVIGAVESIRDITARKKIEKKLRYVADHDSVTGLYNRRYFEREIKNRRKKNGTVVGLIVSDVDGLKLVNDTLGHQEGDRLLRKSAQILKEACPEQSIITRIGGDEFCVILRHTSERELYAIHRKMIRLVNEYNQNGPHIPLSISHGIAFRNDSHVDLLQLFKEAEQKMYYEKLLHSQSAKSQVVDVLTKALEVRDYITEGHADRLSKIVEEIASSIGLPEYQINNLRLFARFHDIGKVGISDAILFKPGKLTSDEFEEMKKHSEIGFRIAQTSPDLVHISDWILKHHEWWNGNGYPFGLAGKDIPLECRILSIADAYDSMSNDRPYRKALVYKTRINELKRFAGIQFDPELIEIFLGLLENNQK